ncbi:MAG: protein kinase domain-containing protein [Ardenticatenaceae bacterium]
MSVYKTDAEIPAVWQVGDVMLDEIEVKAKLGEGHLGAKDLVYHRGFKVELAVTSVEPDLFAAQKQELMRQVGKWVQLGLHPHVVTCHYVREMGGVARIFAEYVADGSLADWIGEGTLYQGGHEVALGRMLDVAIQMAWGLSYAHEKGVPHQNVTPENVMLMGSEPNSNPIAKLTDFGCPKAVTSDIYGWGLSVISMFRGQNEWQEGVIAADVLADVVKNGFQCTDADIIPPMPAALADLLRDCAALASELADSPANKKAMGLVANELIAIYEQEMGHPYASKQPQPATLFADNLNNRAVSLAEVGEMEHAMPLWQAAIDENPLHIEARYNFEVARWRRGELQDDYALVLRLKEVCNSFPDQWLPNYLLAQVHLERGDIDAAITLLEAAAQLAPDEAQIQAALVRARANDVPTARCVRRLEGHKSYVESVAFSPDGRFALSGSYDETVKLWDLADGRCVRTLCGHTESVTSVAFDADGHWALTLNV